MAQEKARTTRARKKADDTEAPVAKKPAPRRARKAKAPPEPAADSIAELAYLMWERGEPGDQTEHWLRAEAELRAA
jgi:Protein of unknown function (DUF2934)